MPAQKRGESRNKKGGRGEERRKLLEDKPLDFKNPIHQRTGLVIGWTSQILLPCVDRRSQNNMEDEFKAYFEKALSNED